MYINQLKKFVSDNDIHRTIGTFISKIYWIQKCLHIKLCIPPLKYHGRSLHFLCGICRDTVTSNDLYSYTWALHFIIYPGNCPSCQLLLWFISFLYSVLPQFRVFVVLLCHKNSIALFSFDISSTSRTSCKLSGEGHVAKESCADQYKSLWTIN